MSVNEEKTEQMYPMFLEDSASMLQSLHRSLMKMEREPGNMDIVHDAFRLAHSMKSEAAYVGHTAAAELLHTLESGLEDIRRGGKPVDRETIDALLSSVDGIQNVLSADGGKKAGIPAGGSREGGAPDSAGFSMFELKLLEEARERGEHFYRLVCEFDRGSSMKHARLYLLVSNLEKIVNVVKLAPDVDEVKTLEENFSTAVVYFTSSRDLDAVYEAVNINDILKYHLTPLSFKNILGENGSDKSGIPAEEDNSPEPSRGFEPGPASDQVRMEKDLFDELVSNISQFQYKIQGLKEASQTLKPAPPEESLSLSAMSDTLQELLQKVRMVSLKDKEAQLSRFVRELSRQLQKSILFVPLGFGIKVERKLVETIHECLLHLVRNAADHGIEGTEERVGSGKNESGNIVVSINGRNGSTCVQVLDDGRGLEESAVRARALSMGYGEDRLRGMDLLSILSLPGFSTKLNATDSSGRGVGLDIIRQKLVQVPGSNLRLFTRPGQGTCFTLELPARFNVSVLIIGKRGDAIVAVPKSSCGTVEVCEAGQFTSDEKGLLWYKNLPVFTEMGRLGAKKLPSGTGYMLFLRHFQAEACLFLEELLFEKTISEDIFKEVEQGNATVLEGIAGSPGTKIVYFDPGSIQK